MYLRSVLRSLHDRGGAATPGRLHFPGTAQWVAVFLAFQSQGVKVHGGSYTADQAHREGWTAVF